MGFSFSSYFTPKDKKFTPMFKEGAGFLHQAGNVFFDMIGTSDKEKRLELIADIRNIEHQNDNVTHNIKKALSETFITPFDREDIYKLAGLLDDVIDLINMVSKKISIYEIDCSNDQSMIKLSKLIQNACFELHNSLQDISNIKKDIFSIVVQISSIETQADDLYDDAIRSLFEQEEDIKLLIKRKEIYKGMEEITDKCESLVHIMESVHIKYS